MSGIRAVADGLVEEFKRLLPQQRKTQHGNLALLFATMLEVRSANLMDLAAALPREADRTDMRYQWIARVLGNTGEMIAYVSLPDYDPNNPVDALKPDHINRLNVGTYEMGSTFKAISFAMALELNKVTLRSMVDVRDNRTHAVRAAL